MYTSCPECGTVFRISTVDLRAAAGYVRCGHCSATFNAVATLSDDPPPTVALARPSEAAARAAPPEPQAATTAVPLPVGDDTLEFDIPEGSWSNFFEASVPAPTGPVAAEPESQPEPELELEAHLERTDGEAAESPEPAGPASDVGTGVGSDTVDEAGLCTALSGEAGLTLDDDDWRALLEEVRDEDVLPEPVYVIGEEAIQSPPEVPPLPDASWGGLAPEEPGSPAPLPADLVPELARPVLTGAAGVPEPELMAPRALPVADRPFIWEPPAPPPTETGRHWGYTAGSVLAALLLVMQLLHLQRDELATNPRLTEPLRRTYAALGMPLWPAWDLRSYEMRNSEAVADRSSPGALDILGRIAVVGDDRVGLPLVRVTLRDRFGDPLGSRVFQPAQYLGRSATLREPVSPGTLIPVEISLKDPGRDAQGFDVDVCVMSRRDGITCRADREPFAR